MMLMVKLDLNTIIYLLFWEFIWTYVISHHLMLSIFFKKYKRIYWWNYPLTSLFNVPTTTQNSNLIFTFSFFPPISSFSRRVGKRAKRSFHITFNIRKLKTNSPQLTFLNSMRWPKIINNALFHPFLICLPAWLLKKEKYILKNRFNFIMKNNKNKNK